MGVILPLLKHLSLHKDVRPILNEKFHMPEWFEQQGIPTKCWTLREVPTVLPSSCYQCTWIAVYCVHYKSTLTEPQFVSPTKSFRRVTAYLRIRCNKSAEHKKLVCDIQGEILEFNCVLSAILTENSPACYCCRNRIFGIVYLGKIAV